MSTPPAQALDQQVASEESPRQSVATPLPWMQLSTVILMRLAEPITFTLIFPFIGDMIWDLGATKNRIDVGLYAGVVECVFALVQTLTVLPWARASDRLGRKPVLLMGLFGCSISSILFGLSTSFTMMVLTRSLNGALNGNVAVCAAVIGEITDETNSARALSLQPFAWVLGSTIGPLLGGYLSQPSRKYPKLSSLAEKGSLAFNGLWDEYPYFLPCLVSSTIALLGIICGAFILEETLPSKKTKRAVKANVENVVSERTPFLAQSGANQRRSYGSDEALTISTNTINKTDYVPFLDALAGDTNQQDTAQGKASVLQVLGYPYIRRLLLSTGFLSLMHISSDAVQVIYFWEPISLGGLSFPSRITGTLFSAAGLMGVFFQFCAFPILQRRYGTLPLYKFCISLFLLIPIILPLANLAARRGLKGGEHEGGFSEDVETAYQGLVLVLVMISIMIKMIVVMAFSCNLVLINRASNLVPGDQLGTINGLAQMSNSIMRAIGPLAASTLYSKTIRDRLAGGYLIWMALFAVGLGGIMTTQSLSDDEE